MRDKQGKPSGCALLDVAPHNLGDDRNPALVHLANFDRAASRNTVRWTLERIARVASGGQIHANEFPWHELGFEHVVAIRAKLAELYEPAGCNLCLSVLRGVIRTCWRLELIDSEERDRRSDIRRVRESSLLRGRVLEREELTKLMHVALAGETATAIRDAAILALLYGCGLRRGEVCSLELSDLSLRAATLTVRGKGGRARHAFPSESTRAALQRWVEARGEMPGPLFCAPAAASPCEPARISERSVYELCKRWGTAAGLEPFTPHDLRRSFVTELLYRGADPLTVQALAGHAMLQTTGRYDRRGDESLRTAAGLLDMDTGAS